MGNKAQNNHDRGTVNINVIIHISPTGTLSCHEKLMPSMPVLSYRKSSSENLDNGNGWGDKGKNITCPPPVPSSACDGLN